MNSTSGSKPSAACTCCTTSRTWERNVEPYSPGMERLNIVLRISRMVSSSMSTESETLSYALGSLIQLRDDCRPRPAAKIRWMT